MLQHLHTIACGLLTCNPCCFIKAENKGKLGWPSLLCHNKAESQEEVPNRAVGDAAPEETLDEVRIG